MTDTDREHRHAVALFRYGVIADLVRLEPGTAGLYERILDKAGADYDIPGTLCVWVVGFGGAKNDGKVAVQSGKILGRRSVQQ